MGFCVAWSASWLPPKCRTMRKNVNGLYVSVLMTTGTRRKLLPPTPVFESLLRHLLLRDPPAPGPEAPAVRMITAPGPGP
jgi:hypothetical protein